ncbi:DUF3240 family protein [Aquimonas voraii]|uniref:DUF3240 domain-containing protein n=1 Tax=Aquimonas voraii TaxID=265719 RepID=A0A1G6XB69_9GAMM|nr:DUF3240 family protein [Aquimonas voraii]SDD75398.1 Protein of unknown function [Aquimonas voraii]
MNARSMVQLVLAYPRPAERQLLAELLDLEPGMGGFTTLLAEGHGSGFARASVQEQVRGRADRGLLLAVMPRETAERLLAGLRERLPSNEIAWWILPVESFGRLA